MPILLGRRQLLRAGVLAGVALPAALRGLAFAATPTAPNGAPGLLVLVSLRGGMDGLHALSPADDAHFVELRGGAGLRTVAEGAGAGHRLDASLDTDFRLHAEAGPLAAIWREGRMAIWPAAGVPEPTRSHFEAQSLMGRGRGLRREAEAGHRGAEAGWLAAWADRLSPPGAGGSATEVTALSVRTGLAPELGGARQGMAASSLAGGLAPPGGDFGRAMLGALHDGAEGPAAAAGRAALARLQAMDRLLPRGHEGVVLPYAPAAADPDYAAARELGQALATVAQAARLNQALVAATVDMGGWDTHDAQAPRMAERLRVLSRGLAAFDRDMQDLPRRWTVLVASEFGRRLRPNRSQGTDHGRAGVVLAFGDPRFGLGRQFGAWPGLRPEALEDGVDLRVATDYRQAFAAVLQDLAPGAAVPFPRGA
jgi:uncharacterized protein (DUF1501 family)